MARSNSPSDVFRSINTHGNDPDVCWEWTGHLGGRDGRGYITVNGVRQLAYRVVWEIFNGPIPDGQKIRHSCDNPACCNPTHLELGTQGDNERDKYRRDRAGYTHDMLKEMRRLNKLGMSYRAIAAEIRAKFGTSTSTGGVGKVLRGERRSDIREREEAERRRSEEVLRRRSGGASEDQRECTGEVSAQLGEDDQGDDD